MAAADSGGASADHRAFVGGATGYTGQAVVERLRALGVETVAHVRPDSRDLAGWRARFEGMGAQVDTTPWDEDAMVARLAELRPTLVFALLGTTQRRMRRDKASGADSSYAKVDLGMTLMLLRGAEATSPAPRFVYLSALGVKPSAPGTYYHARWEVEQALRASSVPWTIARPSFITGSDRGERRPLEQGGAVVAAGVLGLAGALGARRFRDRWGPIDAATLAEGLVGAALDPAAEGAVLTSDALRGAR
ncbi:MAG: NAD(P)H-binding protein [Deltaproteobacteria bacterium]|nr:NAD(P)H-binding protein [Deltaproteobacteria bacterium]MCB9785399.1 NAD(P)H-binding protein [Deltaproteobacteria bacterium]